MNENTKAYFAKKVMTVLSEVLVDFTLDESVSTSELYAAVSYTMLILDALKNGKEKKDE